MLDPDVEVYFEPEPVAVAVAVAEGASEKVEPPH